MTIEATLKFLQATAEKEPLRQGLSEIIGVGDGDVSSAQALDENEAQALLGERGVHVTMYAAQQGYSFTVAELKAAVTAFQRVQTGELTVAEFNAALGLNESAARMSDELDSVGKTVDLYYRGVRYRANLDDDASGPAMQVLNFMKKSAQDEALRTELKAILNVGDGDISTFNELDPEEMKALQSERGALVAQFAARHGYMFTMADLFAVTDAFQRVQSGELSEDGFKRFLKVDVASNEFFPFISNVMDLTYKGFHYSVAMPAAGQDNALQVVRFMQQSENDGALSSELQTLIGGDGNISAPAELDESEARALLISDRSNQIVDLGAKYGFRFSVADLTAVVGAFQLVNSGKLSMDECTRILSLKNIAQEDSGALSQLTNTIGRMYKGVRF